MQMRLLRLARKKTDWRHLKPGAALIRVGVYVCTCVCVCVRETYLMACR